MYKIILLIYLSINLFANSQNNHLSTKIENNSVHTSNIFFSEEESLFLKEHPILKVSSEDDYPPFDFIKKGKPVGYSIDILNLISEKTGFKIEYITDNWKNLQNKIKNKEIDIIHTLKYSKKREKFLLFSDGFITGSQVIFVRNETHDIKSFNDFKGKKIGLIKGESLTSLILSKKEKNFNPIMYSDYLSLLKSLSFGDIDAAVIDINVGHYLKKENGLLNIGVVGDVIELEGLSKEKKFRIGIRKDYILLKNIINKGLASISDDELKQLNQKWFGFQDNTKKLSFTKAEQKWLDKKISLKYVYDVDWLPFEWKNELGHHTGIIYDILSLIQDRSGIKLQQIPTEKWSEAVSLMKEKKADMYSGVGENKERKSYVNFSRNIIFKTPYVFVSRVDDKNDYFETYQAIEDKKAGVVDGYTIHGILKEKKPNIPIITVKSLNEGFEKVRDKTLDIFIVNASTAKYFINRKGYQDLKIVTKTEFVLKLKVALQKDLPNEVMTILDKAISSITDKERSDIYTKRTEHIIENKTDWTLLFKIAGIGCLIIGFVLYNNRRLTRTVNEKTFELQTLLSSFDKNVIASKIDTKGIITYASDAFCEISGYTSEELIGQPQNIVIHPDSLKEEFKELWKTIESGNTWEGEIKSKIKQGGFYWVNVIISPEYNTKGELIGYSAIRQDITAQKEVEKLSETQTEQLNEIQKFQALTVGREDRMVELKEVINDLSSKLMLPKPFSTDFIGTDGNDDIIENCEELEINNILDIASLQRLLDNFCNSIEIASAIIDIKGNVLAASRWQKACTDFHRVNENSCSNCIESDTDLSLKLQDGEEFSIYKCKNGLVDCAAPIIINGQHLANVFIGQFLIEKPDILFFKEQSDKYDYNQKNYLKAIDAVPIIDEDKLPYILKFLGEFTKVITSLSIEKVKAVKTDTLNKKVKLAAINLAEDANLAKTELLKHQDHLEELIESRTKEITEQKKLTDSIMNAQNNIVISTDGLELKSTNKAFLEFFDVKDIGNFIKSYGKCICDAFDIDESGKYVQKMMNNEKWVDYVYNRPTQMHKTTITRDNKQYIFSITSDEFIFNYERLQVAVFTDITQMETTIDKLDAQKILLETLFVSAPDAITLLRNDKWVDCNSAAIKLFGVKSKADFLSKLSSEFSPEFQSDGKLSVEKAHDAVSKALKMGSYQMEWDHIRLDNKEVFTCEVILSSMMIKNEAHIYGIIRDISQRKALENKVKINSINLEKAKIEIEGIHKHTRDSIEYASLIQGALIPENQIFISNFSDYLTIWHPKDIVGGDIYLFEELRDKDECLLMVIDCTGHGVPGAFVTMLVKAIERQIVAKIDNDRDIEVSPAWILNYFNKKMKTLLQQENDDSISNAGFDGGILYYNKKEAIIRFAGAETPLFYTEDNELKIIKGNRHSIGYKKSDANYEFKEHEIEVKDGMQFYVTTDGYLDQNGGDKGFPFGKKRFVSILEKYKDYSFANQQEILLYEMQTYQKDEERNDDITIVGIKI